MMATVVLTVFFAVVGGARVRRAIGVACLMLAAWGVTDVARAQHPGHAEHHEMYKNWQRPIYGGSCCNAQSPTDPNGDCRPTTAYLDDDGEWRARVAPGPDGFAYVPRSSILPRAPDGRCHVCARGFSVLCFAPCDPRS